MSAAAPAPVLRYVPALAVTVGMHIRTNGGYWFVVGGIEERGERVYFRESDGISGGSYPQGSSVPTLVAE